MSFRNIFATVAILYSVKNSTYLLKLKQYVQINIIQNFDFYEITIKQPIHYSDSNRQGLPLHP